MIDSDSDALSGVGSDEEARPLNTAEEQAAKRAKLPVVNPFDLMQERRMSFHQEPAEAMPLMAAIERDRQTKLKNATKTGGHTSGPRKSGQCQAQFDCTHSYATCRVLRLFDPSYVAEHEATIDSASVRELALVIPLAM